MFICGTPVPGPTGYSPYLKIPAAWGDGAMMVFSTWLIASSPVSAETEAEEMNSEKKMQSSIFFIILFLYDCVNRNLNISTLDFPINQLTCRFMN